MIRKFFAGALALLASISLASTPAFASTLSIKDGASATQSIGTTTRASDSALIYNMDTVVQGTATDRGASVTTAGTAQQLMASNTARRGFSIQNQSSGACYINGSGSATQDYHSLLIAAGSYYETKDSHVGTGAISVICSLSAASVYAREW